MNRIIATAVTICLLNPSISNSQELPAAMREGSIESGNYHVGFKLIHTYDSTRTFIIQDSIVIFRPIQMAVWYPAEINQGAKKMQYLDYYKAHASEINFNNIQNEKTWNAVLDAYKNYFTEQTGKGDLVNRVFNCEIKVWDSPPSHSGKFPLIIYACGFGNSFDENTLLCEYLASYGNIVISFPTHGFKGRQMTSDEVGIETQTRDIEFVLSKLINSQNVDSSKISIIGFSWGGVSNVIAAMRNEKVKKVVSIDGSIIYGGAPEILTNYYSYTPSTFKVPFLYFKRANDEKYNLDFYENINCFKKIITLTNLAHDDLTSINFCLPSTFQSEKEYMIAWEQYKGMCKTILDFLITTN